jgi:cobalt/nickel transport system permease protein
MGVVQCLLGWCVYRAVLGRGQRLSGVRQYLAAWSACVVGVAGGAALVPLETGISGVLQIPWASFLVVMVGVHLLIGFVEGLITFAVLAYVRKVRPEAMGLPATAMDAVPSAATPIRAGAGVLALSLVGTAVVLAGLISWFASTHPDGLDSSLKEQDGVPAVRNDSPVVASASALQSRWSLLPDYSSRQVSLGQAPRAAEEAKGNAWPNISGWTSLSGLIGTAVTLVLVYAIAAILRRSKRLPTRQ